ncbi:MAG: hypothetical protein ACOYL6_12035 [Bacteriovoracaceae bacterium]
MIYVLSPIIYEKLNGLWFEGAPYKRETIYEIKKEGSPPVNYSQYTLKPHSLPHIESPLHVNDASASIDHYFKKQTFDFFHGKCLLLKLKNTKFKETETSGIFHWEITRDELKNHIYHLMGENYIIEKIALTICDEELPLNEFGGHDPNFVITLSIEAANYLSEQVSYNAYLTSWKSSDFQPGKKDRPIHNILFKKGLIYECLNFRNIPEGEYYFVGFPLPLENASESPCCPIFFSKDHFK